MKRILVIADDFSGAAEIAGIGHRFGLSTRLFREPLDDGGDGLTVIDTDSRRLSAEAAAARVSTALGCMNARCFDFVYKKVDSVLRGPVRDEIVTGLAATAKRRCILMPQNPSRGRTIRGGVYFVNETPLERTEFARDPEYPATTSDARQRAGLLQTDTSILLPDADSLEDVRRTASSIAADVLPVGGSDFFEAILGHNGFHPANHATHVPLPRGRLFVCGTASVQRDELLRAARSRNVVSCPVSLHENPQQSIDLASTAMAAGSSAVVYIEHKGARSKLAADELQARLVDLCHAVMADSEVRTLFAEGGSTAAGICERLSWKKFAVRREWSPGVVEMTAVSPEGITVFIVKPGSYAWPEEVWH